MERKLGVAGGSKWTYEATFHIAMKGGREYYTTAAISFYLETSGVQNSNRYLNVVHFFNASVDLTSVAA